MLVRNPAVRGHTKLIVRIVVMALPVAVLFVLLSQTAFARTTTYVITDGDQTTVFTTSQTDPADVLAAAGFTLGADDTYTTAQGEDISEITVQRSQLIRINYHGESMEVCSYGETLEELCNRIGLSVYGSSTASMPLGTVTYDGMEVTIDDIVEQEQTYTVEIPFGTTYCDAPALAEGERKVVVEGVVGQMLTTATVKYVNTVEESRTVLSQTVTQEPVDRIVLVGTGEGASSNAPAIGDGMIVTADGEILTYSHSAQFKTTAYTHTDAGCDKITATGTTVRIGTVAVDPRLIPYGTRMFIVTNDGKYVYGIATAEDCGGSIKGNRLDLYFPTTKECFTYGVRNATVYFLN